MGLGMGHRLMKRWSFLLFFISTSALSSYIFTGCEGTYDNTTYVEYDVETVNKAMTDALSGQDPSDIEPNQFFLYEDNFQVELADPQIRGTFESHILEVNETKYQYELLVLNTEISYDQFGESTKNVSEQEVTIDKDSFELLESNTSFKDYFGHHFLKSNVSINNQNEIKLYNLTVDDIKLPYPQKVQKKMGCSASSPCLFSGQRVRFLLHEYVSKNKPLKFAIDRIYMKDGPYLASTYSSCMSRFYETEQRDYYIKQCSVLRDFGLKEAP